jgi:hypothetical protein
MACLENLPEEAESQNIISVPSELMKSVSSASSCLELTVGTILLLRIAPCIERTASRSMFYQRPTVYQFFN